MGRRQDEFERVAMPHVPGLLRFALRLTHELSSAEDLAQETLLLAWRGFHRFEIGTNARAWLFRILINASHAETRKTRASVPIGDLRAASGFEFLEVNQALDRLGADQRTVLLLAAAEGFTCREISDILSIPMGTVMSRLSRARETMREALYPIREKALR